MTDEYFRLVKAAQDLFKFCIIGDGGVGKTTFINYLTTGNLVVQQGDLRRTPYVTIEGCTLGGHKIQLYDLAGQRGVGTHPLDHMQTVVLKGTDMLFFFYSLDRLGSYTNIKKWYDEIKGIYDNWGDPVPPMFLVANKLDLPRKVETINGEVLVENVPEFVAYAEISLLSGENVPEFLTQICDELDSVIRA